MINSVIQDTKKLIQTVAEKVSMPAISEVLLPQADSVTSIKDEFGFVILEDGSVGPFYVCLGDTNQRLNQHLQTHGRFDADVIKTALMLGGSKLHESALALGAFNAMSQSIMRQAGFDPVASSDKSGMGGPETHVGMIGYFSPMIDRLTQKGYKITVIEKQPERAQDDCRVQVSTSPEPLKHCDYVICTASVLINNTIDDIINACSSPRTLNLIGPSASGLPDVLFERGVHSMGGVLINDLACLKAAMASDESWGQCGQKYQLTNDTYPGLAQLL